MAYGSALSCRCTVASGGLHPRRNCFATTIESTTTAKTHHAMRDGSITVASHAWDTWHIAHFISDLSVRYTATATPIHEDETDRADSFII